ncbi:class I SAM-dependent methyltransferase [Frondihabitans peucedani]|uniref:SAM-dependent methyltransferase n=1 Tax=Frondihabitans peucedani TaxID=598626 RepID=A0ABP8E3L7_9MICO
MIALDAAEAHFDARHEGKGDPWGLERRWYEIRKRRILLASLPEERLGRVLEIGCSVGISTLDLAERSDSILAVDVSGEAVRTARERLAAVSHARVERWDVTDGLPEGEFDLVVLSEVGYYLSLESLGVLLERARGILSATGTIAACHWRPVEGDFLQSGDDVHRAVTELDGFTTLVHHVEADFVLDVVGRDQRSVAERTELR